MFEPGENLRKVARSVRRSIRLSPMHGVLRGIRKRGVDLGEFSALECFAFTGNMHTLDYAPAVKELDLWEINPEHRPILLRRFPQAVVRTVDSYEEMLRCDKTFDLIVVDNSPLHGGHIEHFDLFPDIFRLVPSSAVLVIDVLPEMNDVLRAKYPKMFSDEVVEARRQFYGVADPTILSKETIAQAYYLSAKTAGCRIEWHFYKKRNPILTYLVMKATRILPALVMAIEELSTGVGLLGI